MLMYGISALSRKIALDSNSGLKKVKLFMSVDLSPGLDTFKNKTLKLLHLSDWTYIQT